MIDINYLKEILGYDPETGVLTWLVDVKPNVKRGQVAGCLHNHGYVVIKINKRQFRAHRLAWAIHYGENPPEEVDHINRKRADNRIKNLRLASRLQQTHNISLPKNNTSGYLGVSKSKNRYVASIQNEGLRVYLGSFKTAEEASSVRQNKAEVMFGEFHS